MELCFPRKTVHIVINNIRYVHRSPPKYFDKAKKPVGSLWNQTKCRVAEETCSHKVVDFENCSALLFVIIGTLLWVTSMQRV